ncbi:MAG: MFS transporter [Aggregatilineales bacterium]
MLRSMQLFRRYAPLVQSFVFILLVIEFLDELIYGAGEAALPVMQSDLGMTYVQVGLLFSIPNFVASIIEPIIGIRADIPGKRRGLVLGGGMMVALSLAVISVAPNFLVLLLAYVVIFPASGAFVSLAQATLMDTEPERHDQNMARWAFAGSIGVIGGALLVFLITSIGLTWREMMFGLAIFTGFIVALTWRFPFGVESETSDDDEDEDEAPQTLIDGLRGAVGMLRQWHVLRWLTLLQVSDLLLDVFTGYLALYLVNEIGLSVETGALVLVVMKIVGLVGDFLVIPLLERVDGVTYVRFSAALQLVLFPAFLLIEPIIPKLIFLGISHFFTAGWYPVLQGRLYSAMPGRSGTVMAVSGIFGLVGTVIPLVIGIVADEFSLVTALWMLMIAPIALFIGVPKSVRGFVSNAEDDASGN